MLSVIPYDGEDDAVRIANDSPYGLAGNIMSGSTEHALRVARRLRACFIGINGTAGYGADTPFGGYKASGVRTPERNGRFQPVHRSEIRRLPRGIVRCAGRSRPSTASPPVQPNSWSSR